MRQKRRSSRRPDPLQVFAYLMNSCVQNGWINVPDLPPSNATSVDILEQLEHRRQRVIIGLPSRSHSLNVSGKLSQNCSHLPFERE